MAEQKKQPETFIPKNRIIETFKSFGYEPDEFDLAYWTRKTVDRYDDMLEKLSKRKEEERERQKEQQVQQIESGQAPTESTLDDNSFFRGEYGLVQFTEDPDGPGPASTSTVWLVDPKAKKLIPFLSETSFNNAMTKPLKEVVAGGGIKKISLSQKGSFELLPDAQGIKEDGIIPAFETSVDSNKISERYGQESNPQVRDVINKQLPGFIKILKSDPNSGISAETLDTVMSDPNNVAFYVNALTYGNYQLPDIYRDLKRRELVKQGKGEFKSMKIIDESIPADQFYASPTGQAIKVNADLALPRFLGDIDTEMLNYSVFNLPDEVYKVLVPPLDWTTPAGQAELDNIKSAYHDVLIKQLEAGTEQAKALADYNWNLFKDELSKKYGIALSDNATQAWGQLENLGKGYAGRGLGDTGLFQEARDKYLQDVRKADERLRETKVDEKNKTEAEYLRKSGTPEQVQTFLDSITDEDEKKAFENYFKPSEEIKKYFSKENLKTLYPDLSEEELNWYAESIIDPTTGLYRSQLQQQLTQNKIQLEQEKKLYQMGDVTVDPTTGKVTGGYGAIYNKALAEEKAYAEYTKAEPFEKSTVTTPATTVTTPAETSTWTPPAGYERIPNVAGMADYTNIISNPTDKTDIGRWGVKKATTVVTQPSAPTTGEKFWTGKEFLTDPTKISEWKTTHPGGWDPLAMTPSAPTTVDPFKQWTTGKTDILGKNWQGYTAITGAEYQTPEQKKLWKNVQSVSGTLYGYKG